MSRLPTLFSLLAIIALLYSAVHQRRSTDIFTWFDNFTNMNVNGSAGLKRMPLYILSHGSPMSLFERDHPAFLHWRKIGKQIQQIDKPKGIAIVSAHWQAKPDIHALGGRAAAYVELNVDRSNPLIYDFYNFPPHYYEETFTSSSSNELTDLVSQALEANNIHVRQTKRGLDHGVWVPFKGVFGDKLDIPLVQISLPVEQRNDLEAEIQDSLRLGKALRSLREQGILVIASGQAVHNLRDYFKGGGENSTYGQTFPPALQEAMSEKGGDQDEPRRWTAIKKLLARKDYLQAHPTSEHFLPFIVGAGAAYDDEPGNLDFTLRQGALVWDMYRFDGFVLVSVSFLAGVLFIASIYDFPLLYTDHGDREVETALNFYMSLFNGPTAVSALLHGMIGLGLIGILAKLHRWTETAKWFDGVSLALFMGAVAFYGGVQVPNLRVLADPTNVDLLLRSSIRTQRESVVDARIRAGDLPKDTEVNIGAEPMSALEREATVKVLSAGHTIILALLAGVLLFQASEWWLERSERLQEDKKREAEAKALGVVPANSSAEKKSQ